VLCRAIRENAASVSDELKDRGGDVDDPLWLCVRRAEGSRERGFDKAKLTREVSTYTALTRSLTQRMVRQLKYHERKLLKKVDFLNVCP